MTSRTRLPSHALGFLSALAIGIASTGLTAPDAARAQTAVQVQPGPAAGGAKSSPSTQAGPSASATSSTTSRAVVPSNTSVQTQVFPAPSGSGPAAPGSTSGGVGAPSGLAVYGAGNPPGPAPNVTGSGSGSGSLTQGPGLVIIPRQ